jgi:hypothetical protein
VCYRIGILFQCTLTAVQTVLLWTEARAYLPALLDVSVSSCGVYENMVDGRFSRFYFVDWE